MSKIKIEIVKSTLGLKKGLVTKVGSTHALQLIESGIAEFADSEDEEKYHARKKANADASNNARKIDAKKSKQMTKGDDERAEKASKEVAAAKTRQQKLTLGRRKSLLSPFAEAVDLKSDEFKLTLETSKDEFGVMLEAAKQAVVDGDADEVEEQRIADELELKEKNEVLEGRLSSLDIFKELIDLSSLTINSTQEEFEALLAEGEAVQNEQEKVDSTESNEDKEEETDTESEEVPAETKKKTEKTRGKKN